MLLLEGLFIFGLMDKGFYADLFVPSRILERGKQLSTQHSTIVYLFVGISLFIELSSQAALGKALSITNVYLFCFIAGPFAGMLAGFICSSLFYWFSEALLIVDKNCSRDQVRSMIAYTSILLLLPGLLTTIEFFMCGNAVFTKYDVVKYMNGSPGVYYSLEFIKILVLGWSLFIQVLGLSRLRDIEWYQVLIVNLVCYLLISGVMKVIVMLIL